MPICVCMYPCPYARTHGFIQPAAYWPPARLLENRVHGEEHAGPRGLCAARRDSLRRPEGGGPGPAVHR